MTKAFTHGIAVLFAGAGDAISAPESRLPTPRSDDPRFENDGPRGRFNAPFLRRAVLLGGAFVLLAGLTWLLYNQMGRGRDRRSGVVHTYEVLNQIQLLTAAVEQAESAERGYLLTGDARYLETFQSAILAEQSTKASLSLLTSDNPGQQAFLNSAHGFAEQRFSLLREAIEIRRNASPEAAISKARAASGRRFMDECRAAMRAMEGEERKLLIQRSKALDAQSSKVRWVLLTGSGSLLVLLVVVGVIIERDIQLREKARRAVRRSDERLRMALDSANAGIWEWDLTTNENVWSDEMWNLYGLEPNSLTPSFEAWRQVIHPEDRSKAEQSAGQAARMGAELNVEFRVNDQNGRQRWLLARGQPLRDARGQVERFIGIALDITHRKQAEEARRASEAQFRSLANAIPQLCWMANADGWIYWYNQRWYEYTGTTPEQMEGWGWQSVHDPEELPKVMERWKASIASGEPFEMVFPLRGADGAFHPFLTRIVPVHDRDGKLIEWFGTNTDITDQLKTQAALRRALEHRRLAMEAADLGSWDYRIETGDVYWDRRCWRMFGVDSEHVLYHDVLERIHPDDRAATEHALQQTITTGEGFNREFRVQWADGSIHWIASHGRVRFEGENGSRRARFIGVNMDITERKEAELVIRQLNSHLEQRVQQRTAELETANKELEAFSYSVSHDLRAPLRGIDGWSLALAEDYADQLDAKAQQYVDRVRGETQRMGLLIDDMLQLSRVSTAEMHFVPVDVTAIVREVAARLVEANSHRRIEFVVEPGLTAAGDARLMDIALTNLLGNAVKFTGPREMARIEFGQVHDAEEQIFFVRDNGVGFDMAYAGALFGAFQRLHKASEFPGTGIGLAIVQRVIHRHRGRVWAKAQRDRGATFYFTIGTA